jgi:hypothetical protein
MEGVFENALSSVLERFRFKLNAREEQQLISNILKKQSVLTTVDPIRLRLRIESRNRHIYDVMSILFDVTMHIYRGKF